MIHPNTIKRNAPCPCGSGRKTKRCCAKKITEFQDGIEAGLTPQEIVMRQILVETDEVAPE